MTQAAGPGAGPGWLAPGFEPPARVALRSGPHLRPIRASDAEIDLPAVMGSRERLWARYGASWAWPPETMTLEQDREDLAHHVQEMADRVGFNYAILDAGETRLLGCVYLYPPEGDDHDATVSWWVVDECAGSELDAELERFVPAWVTGEWAFSRPRLHPPGGPGW